MASLTMNALIEVSLRQERDWFAWYHVRAKFHEALGCFVESENQAMMLLLLESVLCGVTHPHSDGFENEFRKAAFSMR